MREARAGGNKRDGNGSNSEQRLLEYFFKSNERKFGDFHHEIYFSTNTFKNCGIYDLYFLPNNWELGR